VGTADRPIEAMLEVHRDSEQRSDQVMGGTNKRTGVRRAGRARDAYGGRKDSSQRSIQVAQGNTHISSIISASRTAEHVVRRRL